MCPVGFSNYREALLASAEVFQRLKGIIKAKFGQESVNVGDEGGFAPNVTSMEAGIELILEAVAQSGFEGKFKIAMDVAASEFYVQKDGKELYDLGFKEKNRN